MTKLKAKLINHVIVFGMQILEGIANRVAPSYVRRLGSKIDLNISIPTWDQKTAKVDIYYPKTERPESGWPVALLIHGGGFRFFSKDSHALVAYRIAELGYLTVAMDYRLTPAHPFPFGLIDVLSVYEWVTTEINKWGGNTDELVIAGESAGANFALGLTLIACGYEAPPMFPEKRQSFKWVIPKKLLLHCGYFQVSGVDKTRDLSGVHTIIRSRMRMIESNYLPKLRSSPATEDWGLVDPLIILEKKASENQRLSSDFPEVFIPVGSSDPVLTDSKRLSKAIQALQGKETLHIYPNAPHALYAMPWHSEYNAIWKDIQSFLVPQAT